MEHVLATLLFLDPQKAPERRPGAATARAEKPATEKRLFCAACRHPITAQGERIQVHGGHEHTFTNPHGFVFHIGCFRTAAGCAVDGAATGEHTWFRGHAWRIAACAGCRTHLGWLFEAAGESFYGLIVKRLTSAAGNA